MARHALPVPAAGREHGFDVHLGAEDVVANRCADDDGQDEVSLDKWAARREAAYVPW